ncbi:MAG: hypothetical protein NTY53_13480 [Kiritimatiellaeota bacterium]|nr:hypothetical protein [Kiritimatiellota bacterium]
MKHTLSLFTALLLAPLAAPHVRRNLPEVPSFGKLRVGSFQSLAAKGCPSRKARLENRGTMTSNAWN